MTAFGGRYPGAMCPPALTVRRLPEERAMRRWVTRADGAWNVVWSCTEQARVFTLSGETLTVVSQWNPSQLSGGRAPRGRLTFVRGE